MSTPRPLPERDLAEITLLAEDDLRVLEGARIFVTGGTGFIGTWLVEALLAADRELGLRLGLTLLTRDPSGYRHRRPHVAGDGRVTLLEGDVRIFTASEPHDFVVHAATPTSTAHTPTERSALYANIVHGMERVLEAASAWGCPRLLFTSSGAVYGRQPADVLRVSEDHPSGPDPLSTEMTYHEGKRAAELQGALSTEAAQVDVVVARLFAFVGPLLPIDAHFAIGNFIRDALDGGPVVVEGDGTPVRSYQYAIDLVAWLLAILIRGEPGRAYNVGSNEVVDVATVAKAVAEEAGALEVEIRGRSERTEPPERYVPDCERARRELGVANTVVLSDAIRRTIAWHRNS
ncbi:MAG: epimerase [Chloroflexi bacterium]|jgi:dTDP-glucose 4,6-dehydratase|nr:epimerase [Chloroflexota bacterium]|tara:strand:+ start:3777 stop:4817 length:1041 start_codon:yes stop_codon:yes gene_type:complete